MLIFTIYKKMDVSSLSGPSKWISKILQLRLGLPILSRLSTITHESESRPKIFNFFHFFRTYSGSIYFFPFFPYVFFPYKFFVKNGQILTPNPIKNEGSLFKIAKKHKGILEILENHKFQLWFIWCSWWWICLKICQPVQVWQ